jgi:hypothetical protein
MSPPLAALVPATLPPPVPLFEPPTLLVAPAGPPLLPDEPEAPPVTPDEPAVASGEFGCELEQLTLSAAAIAYGQRLVALARRRRWDATNVRTSWRESIIALGMGG